MIYEQNYQRMQKQNKNRTFQMTLLQTKKILLKKLCKFFWLLGNHILHLDIQSNHGGWRKFKTPSKAKWGCNLEVLIELRWLQTTNNSLRLTTCNTFLERFQTIFSLNATNALRLLKAAGKVFNSFKWQCFTFLRDWKRGLKLNRGIIKKYFKTSEHVRHCCDCAYCDGSVNF